MAKLTKEEEGKYTYQEEGFSFTLRIDGESKSPLFVDHEECEKGFVRWFDKDVEISIIESFIEREILSDVEASIYAMKNME